MSRSSMKTQILVRDSEVLYDFNHQWQVIHDSVGDRLKQVMESDTSHIEKLYIFDQLSPDLIPVVDELLKKLVCFNSNVDIYIDDPELRKRLDFPREKLTHITLDHSVKSINPNVVSLSLDVLPKDSFEILKSFNLAFPELKSMKLSSDNNSSLQFLNWYLTENPPQKLNLETFSLSILHKKLDPNGSLLVLKLIEFINCISLENLKELQLEIGCDDLDCDCMSRILMSLNTLNSLSKLSLVHKITKITHNDLEAWTIKVMTFATQIPNLMYLFISTPSFTNLNSAIGDNVEGNFIRIKKIYTSLLPLLSSKLHSLVLPNFFQLCAYYEQITNDLLWNGCKCPICNPIHSKIDSFIMNHQYYEPAEYDLKDVLTTIFFQAVGQYQSSYFQNIDGLSYETETCLPLCKRKWDSHLDFLCISSDDCDEKIFDERLKITPRELEVVAEHFFIDFAKLFAEIPNLEYLVFNACIFQCGYELNGTRFVKKLDLW